MFQLTGIPVSSIFISQRKPLQQHAAGAFLPFALCALLTHSPRSWILQRQVNKSHASLSLLRSFRAAESHSRFARC